MPDDPPLAGFVDDPYAAAIETLCARTLLAQAQTVADLGAGDGSFAVLLRARMDSSATLVLVDREPASPVALARTRQVTADLAHDDPACQVDLAVARFLLVQSQDPRGLVRRLTRWVHPGGTLALMEPITSTGRVGSSVIIADTSAIPNPDAGLTLPGLIADAGLELASLDAIAPIGVGGSSVGRYLMHLTGAAPLPDELVLLPTLVVATARLSAAAQGPPAPPD
jgi:hypothetical protein